ncbi:type II secretion system F family protein [Actinoplanes sp. NPDC049681]|uniref:type II secretion system F family protein n=1 Tax=Actinoplanes sp. NPDC049681 TaxID=3363905 RepID=UPI0037B62294
MTTWPWLFAAVLLATAALVAVWPVRHGLRRLALPSRPLHLVAVGARVVRSPRRLVVVSGTSAVLVGAFLGGPVAALIALAYAMLGARALNRRAARRQSAEGRARDLDELSALAADLRAGLPRATAPIGGRLGELTAAAGQLAERTGAPTADLIERIEADARAADRAAANAAAQAAGAQATAVLLAALPIGGIALGYGIGVDPLHVLLHTPAGAACAIGAVVLQVAGLLWADRLTNGSSGERPPAAGSEAARSPASHADPAAIRWRGPARLFEPSRGRGSARLLRPQRWRGTGREVQLPRGRGSARLQPPGQARRRSMPPTGGAAGAPVVQRPATRVGRRG